MFTSRAMASVSRSMLASRQQIKAVQMLRPASLVSMPLRYMAEVSVVQDSQQDVASLEAEFARLGVDTVFSEQKHAYVLTFPWNFPGIIEKFEADYRPLADSSYWARFVENSRAVVDFNNLFREFHQFCSLPDAEGIEKICEGKLAAAVNQSVERIHFHGLDIEMANLTVNQPSIKVLKVEIQHGLQVERSANGSEDQYTVSQSSVLGAPTNYYVPKNDQRSFLDFLEEDHKPYCVAVTALIESPMKMYVQNQNYSKIIFGSDDSELVKNVVRFEANLKWSDLASVLPVDNKKSLKWKITDFNNLMNENPYF